MTINSKESKHRLPQIYNAAVEALSGLLDTRNMFIALYNEQEQSIEFALAYENGEPASEEDMLEGRPYGPRSLGGRKGLTDWVIHHKKPLLIAKDFYEWTESQDDIEAFPMETKCWLGAPMLIGDQVIGVIGLQNFEREGVFDEQHLDLLLTIASQAATAIENARLHEQAIQAEREQAIREQQESQKLAAERLQRLELLQRINELIAEAGRDPQVLESIAQTANEISGGKQTNIYLYDATVDRFTGGVRVLQDGRIEQVEIANLPGPDGLAIHTAKTQKEILVENVNDYSGLASTFATRNNLQAFVGVPLTIAHRHSEHRIAVGVLFVYFTEPRPFSDDYKELLQHLANQAAAAIYAGIQESALAKEQLAALGTAAAALQHRLSNTINVIIPAVMRLRLRDKEDETYQGILDTIQRNVNFATEVIRRMQTPLHQEDFVKTNISSLLSSAIAKCCQEDDRFSQIRIATDLPDISTSTGSGITREIFIKTDIDPELPETYACIGQLTEVFRVLVENAIKAIYPQTGTITIICRLKRRNPQTRVEITVQDTGSGIDKETQRRLFRQPIPRQELGEGAGLGLWLSQIIIQNHQGEITLHETKINDGSTFLVSLPILYQPPLSYALQQGDLQ